MSVNLNYKKKLYSLIEKIILIYLPANIFLAYVIFSIIGLTINNLIYYLYGILIQIIVLFCVDKFIKRIYFDNYILAGMSILIVLIIIDTLIYCNVIKLNQAHDLVVIPYQVTIYTKEGYKTATQEKNFQAKAFSAGQVSSYLKDDNFHEPRWITVKTDSLGLRNAADQVCKSQDIILMGDSFCFGYGTDHDKIWSELIKKETGRNVYNIGVYGAGPGHQIELLKYLLDTKKITLAQKPYFFLLYLREMILMMPVLMLLNIDMLL